MNQKVIEALNKADGLYPHVYFRENGCACAIGQLIKELPEEKRAELNIESLTGREGNLSVATISNMHMKSLVDVLVGEYEITPRFLQAIQRANDNFCASNSLEDDAGIAAQRKEYIIGYAKEYRNEA